MSVRSSKAAAARSGRRADAGYTVLEIVSALAIMSLALAAVHLTVGTAMRSKLLASSWVTNQQQGRQVAAWVADRVRQAGFRKDPASPFLRCRDSIVAQDPAYQPAASSLYVTSDVDNDGTPENHGFYRATVGGVNVVMESVITCTAGALPVIAPITDAASVDVQGLTFSYYDAAGNPVTNLTNPAAIQSIRLVEVTVQVRAGAGAQGPTTQTWPTHVWLRNP